jgi:hypothetical protein
MKNGTTFFLKAALVVMGLPILALCIFIVPQIGQFAAELYPEMAFLQYAIMAQLYATTIPFYFALYQAYQLLRLMDRQMAFSDLSVSALKKIKWSAALICCLHCLGLPLLFLLAERDDAPGLIVIGMVLVFASLVIAVFAAVLQVLLREAIAIKTENDLTV